MSANKSRAVFPPTTNMLTALLSKMPPSTTPPGSPPAKLVIATSSSKKHVVLVRNHESATSTPDDAVASTAASREPSDKVHKESMDVDKSTTPPSDGHATPTAADRSSSPPLTGRTPPTVPSEKGAKSPVPETGKRTRDSEETDTEDTPTKRVKADEDEADGLIKLVDDVPMPYQSIISIKVPPRTKGPPTEHDESSHYGNEPYQNSMIIYWADECGNTYNDVKMLFDQKFPDQSVVEEAIRRRHIRALVRLAKQYGVYSCDEIPEPIKKVKNRGKKRSPRLPCLGKGRLRKGAASDVQNKSDLSNDATKTPQGTVDSTGNKEKRKPEYVKKADKRAIEKALIVVWKDHPNYNYSFTKIRDKLEQEFGWKVRVSFVEKIYYLSRPRVYGVGLDIPIESKDDSEHAPKEESDSDSIVSEKEEKVLEAMQTNGKEEEDQMEVDNDMADEIETDELDRPASA